MNGELRQTVRFDTLVRDPRQLLAEVAAFTTLGDGDVLMLGCAAARPRAQAGDRIELRSAALGAVSHTLVAEAA